MLGSFYEWKSRILSIHISPTSTSIDPGSNSCRPCSMSTPPSVGLLGASPRRSPEESALEGLRKQRIPRRVVQTGRTFAEAVRKHGQMMRAWWALNPEYEYEFYDDDAASRLVRRSGSHAERHAFSVLLTGSQRADLFRLLALKYRGGVYADIDSELRAPLRRVVPSRASAVVGRFWNYEFMAYEAGHPLVVAAAAKVVANVRQQLEWHAGCNASRCRSPHSCVLRVTGPPAYFDGVSTAARAGGCVFRGWLPTAPARECAAASDERFRRVHVCASDTGNVYRTWACNASKHWDCRNSGAKRGCGAGHYVKARDFFNLSRVPLGMRRGALPPPPGKCQNERLCGPWEPRCAAGGK